jgi:hypothetical protein
MPKYLRLPAATLTAALLTAPWVAHAALTDPSGGNVPEPDSLWLVGLALGVMVWFGWRSRR